MSPAVLIPAVAAALVAVAVLSRFGYRFYADIVATENEKHARQGAKH